MTKKERLADALLMAAKAWQGGNSRFDIGMNLQSEKDTEFSWAPDDSDWNFQRRCDDSASCALSEVAGMGFDLVNASGTDCEKVAEMLRASLEPAPTGHAYGYVSSLKIEGGE